MLASFKTCVLALARDKALLVWALAFPIILTCIFMGMFSGFDDAYAMVGSTLGVVHDESFEKAAGLDATLASISDTDSETSSLSRQKRKQRTQPMQEESMPTSPSQMTECPSCM